MLVSNFFEVGVVAYLAIIGLLAIRYSSPSWMHILHRFALALPLGYSCVVLSSLVSLLIFGAFVPGLVLSLPVPFLLWMAKSESGESLSRRFVECGVVTLLYIACAILFRWANPVVLSFDSFHFVFMGFGFANGVPLSEFVDRFASFPLFVVPFHALAQYVGQDYSSVCSPMFMSCAVIGVGYFLRDHFVEGPFLRRLCSMLLVLSVVGMILSSYFVVHQSFYVNGHTAHGCLLFLATMEICSLRQISLESQRATYFKLVPIFILLTGVLLGRLEGLLVVSLLLVLLCEGQHLSAKQLMLGVLGLVAVHGAWAYLILERTDVWDALTSPKRMLGMTAGPVLVCSVYAVPLFRRWVSLWKYFAVLALLGGVAFYACTKPNQYAMSVASIVTNAMIAVPWGILWPAMVVGLTLAIVRERTHYDSGACYMIVSYLLLILMLGCFREPYRLGWGDSANRMLGQSVPLVMYLLGRGILPSKAST